MINKLDFNAKNLTSNAGIFLLLEEAKNNGIFDLIKNSLTFAGGANNLSITFALCSIQFKGLQSHASHKTQVFYQ